MHHFPSNFKIMLLLQMANRNAFSVKNVALYVFSIGFISNCVTELNASKTIVVNDAGDVQEGCQALLENFAATVSLFTFCAISHARPIRLCEKCIVQYVNATTAHDEILKLEDTSGQACKQELINLDRLEVIESAMKNVGDLWDRGKCNNCFSVADGRAQMNLSNSTVQFQKLSADNDACFRLHVNESTVCEDCAQVYSQVNEFYDQLKETVGDGDVCIDIVDAMNTTRSTWSQVFGCTLNKMQLDLTFIITASVVTLIPVVFYIAAKLLSNKAETKLLQQSRLGSNLKSPDDSSLPVDGTSRPSTSLKQDSWRS